MKISYIANINWDEGSAPSIHVDEICRNFSLMGHEVRLYLPAYALVRGPKPYEIVPVAAFRTLRSLWFQLAAFVVLSRDIGRERPDVLYSRHDSLLIVPALLGLLRGVATVVEVNGKLREEVAQETTFRSKLLLRLGILFVSEKFTFAASDGLIAMQQGIRQYIASYGISPAKIRVLPNAVDPSMFAPAPARPARERLGLAQDAIYVGYVGSFYDWQGIRYLIEAARLVRQRRPHVAWLLIGNGSERVCTASLAQELPNVNVRGAVAHGDVPDYIAALDICVNYPVNARAWATSPFKIYEYLACGRCTVSSDIGGMRDEFGDAVVYVKPESAEALADTLVSLADDGELRERMGARGRRFIENGHTWSAAARGALRACSEFAHPRREGRERPAHSVEI